jgi:hypothetical protein
MEILVLVAWLGLAIWLLILTIRFVNAHERIAAALDDMAHRPPAVRSSPE